MDVALVASLVSPIRSAEANGPHAVIVDLAAGLEERGHRVTVYAAAGSRVPPGRLVEIPVASGAGDASIQPGRPPASAANHALRHGFERLFAAVRRGEHDVVSQHAFDAEALELCAGLRVLHTLHLPPIVPAVTSAARATRAPLATVSAASRRQWADVGVDAAVVLPNGVPDRGWSRRDPDAVALVAGRISPEKGTATALRASLAAGLRPWVAGDRYDGTYFEEEVRPLLADADDLGAVPRRQLAELMGRSAVLVMPIEWEEPFGLVAAEAQMAGCPVVAYRRGALPEVVEDGVSGVLVEPGDERGLVEAIGRARRLNRQAVRRSALERLHVSRMLDAYERALRRLVRAAQPAHHLAHA
ncbi:MAG: glycosyltransferase [Chloroflexota bacterium]|nr:glycosyltransferase [Chloroflexota bacterium]